MSFFTSPIEDKIRAMCVPLHKRDTAFMKWPLALPVKGLKEARKQTFWPSFTALFRGAWSQTYEAYLVTLLVRNDDTFLIRVELDDPVLNDLLILILL